MDDPLHPSFLLLGAKKRFPQHNKRALPSCHSGSKAHTVDFVSGQAHKLWPLLCNFVFRLCIFSMFPEEFHIVEFCILHIFKKAESGHKNAHKFWHHVSHSSSIHFHLAWSLSLSRVSLFDFLETSKPSIFRLFYPIFRKMEITPLRRKKGDRSQKSGTFLFGLLVPLERCDWAMSFAHWFW